MATITLSRFGQQGRYKDSFWTGVVSQAASEEEARQEIEKTVREGKIYNRDEQRMWWRPVFNYFRSIGSGTWEFEVQREFLD